MTVAFVMFCYWAKLHVPLFKYAISKIESVQCQKIIFVFFQFIKKNNCSYSFIFIYFNFSVWRDCILSYTCRRCIYSQSLLLDTSVTCLRRPLHTDGEGTNNIAVFIWSYTHGSKAVAQVLTVALTMRKVLVCTTSLKFDKNMKGDSKLLITEVTFGFCLLC